MQSPTFYTHIVILLCGIYTTTRKQQLSDIVNRPTCVGRGCESSPLICPHCIPQVNVHPQMAVHMNAHSNDVMYLCNIACGNHMIALVVVELYPHKSILQVVG